MAVQPWEATVTTIRKTFALALFALIGLTAVADAEVIATDAQPMQSSMQCGMAPLPPIGCRVGQCVCEQSGWGTAEKCRWTFICN